MKSKESLLKEFIRQSLLNEITDDDWNSPIGHKYKNLISNHIDNRNDMIFVTPVFKKRHYQRGHKIQKVKDLKKWWNESADHTFFNNKEDLKNKKEKIIAIHNLIAYFYDKENISLDEFVKRKKSIYLDLKNKIQKNEISAIGFLNHNGEHAYEICKRKIGKKTTAGGSNLDIFFYLNPRRITHASLYDTKTDVFSDYPVETSQEEINNFKRKIFEKIKDCKKELDDAGENVKQVGHIINKYGDVFSIMDYKGNGKYEYNKEKMRKFIVNKIKSEKQSSYIDATKNSGTRKTPSDWEHLDLNSEIRHKSINVLKKEEVENIEQLDEIVIGNWKPDSVWFSLINANNLNEAIKNSKSLSLKEFIEKYVSYEEKLINQINKNKKINENKGFFNIKKILSNFFNKKNEFSNLNPKEKKEIEDIITFFKNLSYDKKEDYFSRIGNKRYRDQLYYLYFFTKEGITCFDSIGEKFNILDSYYSNSDNNEKTNLLNRFKDFFKK
jgi:hypothetical protein